MGATGELADLLERCRAEGQGHVFRFWDGLDETRRGRLLGQVATLDFDLLAEHRSLISDPPAPAHAARFEPPELFPLVRDGELERRARAARERGEEVLRAGRVGYVLVAGGQGSRLGFDGPKGAFPLGPVTGRTLFGWLAARIEAAARRFGCDAPWYVMTSESNDAETRSFFEEQGYFGLGEGNVRFFQQRMLPALDAQGRVLMRGRDELFLAPNGHGGTLQALAGSGCLEDAARRGVDVLSYFQVDGPLARPADPLFIGLHDLAGAEMSSKVVAKRDAHEKVGVIGRVDGRLGCIEYSDLPDELRHATDADGKLLFRAGNMANHLLQRAFVERVTEGGLHLPWHVAGKRMTVVDEDGALVEREGFKFETFVFDALGEARASATLEADRGLEFAPVKNARGADSPASCRAHLGRLFAGWVERAGGDAPPAGPAHRRDGGPRVEVDPRFAEDEHEFRARWPATPRVVDGGHLYEVGS